MKHKLKPRLLGEISITSAEYTTIGWYTTLMAESKELNSLLMKVKEESEKVVLKLKIQKIKIMAYGPITSWQMDRKTIENSGRLCRLQNHCRW